MAYDAVAPELARSAVGNERSSVAAERSSLRAILTKPILVSQSPLSFLIFLTKHPSDRMSRLDDFLAHNIDGYLMYDLRTMQVDDADGKGVGFPLLMSTCAGIEFLGALLSSNSFNTFGKGYVYFGDYWKSALYPAPSPYTGFGDPTYQLVRHGIAHTFLLKGDVGVTRNDPGSHFKRDSTGILMIHAVQLARDFIDSYEHRVKSHLDPAAPPAVRQRMEARLSEIESVYQAQSLHHGSAFQSAPLLGATAPITQSNAPAGTPGGPTGPLPAAP
jgi:hypothetical protein